MDTKILTDSNKCTIPRLSPFCSSLEVIIKHTKIMPKLATDVVIMLLFNILIKIADITTHTTKIVSFKFKPSTPFLFDFCKN